MNTAVQENQKNGIATQEGEELTISMKSFHEQVSPMSDEMKAEKRASSPSLHKIFEETLKAKGEYPLKNFEWTSDDELEVEGLSAQTLHSFVLEAEKLGKKISYTRTTKVKISD